MNSIQTLALDKFYGQHHVIRSMNFTVQEGSIVALVGKNGAGKSTLFKVLSGQELPSSGDIEIAGHRGNTIGHGRERVGFMIEEPEFFPDYNAHQNLTYFAIQRGVTDRARIDELLNLVSLDDPQDRRTKFKGYSTGMKKRLGLALALLHHPDILVLDEPTSGLDAEGINTFRKLMLKLNRELHMTILISSHILTELQLIETHFAFLRDGEIVEELTAAALHEKGKQKLHLRVDPVEQAVRVLEETYPDLIYTVLTAGELELLNYIDRSGEINRRLHQAGVTVHELMVQSENLEDYFLNLVGGPSHA